MNLVLHTRDERPCCGLHSLLGEDAETSIGREFEKKNVLREIASLVYNIGGMELTSNQILAVAQLRAVGPQSFGFGKIMSRSVGMGRDESFSTLGVCMYVQVIKRREYQMQCRIKIQEAKSRRRGRLQLGEYAGPRLGVVIKRDRCCRWWR